MDGREDGWMRGREEGGRQEGGRKEGKKEEGRKEQEERGDDGWERGSRKEGREDERGEDGRKGRMEEDSKDGAGRKGGGWKAYREWDPSSPLVGWSSSVRPFVSGRGRPCVIARLSPWME